MDKVEVGGHRIAYKRVDVFMVVDSSEPSALRVGDPHRWMREVQICQPCARYAAGHGCAGTFLQRRRTRALSHETSKLRLLQRANALEVDPLAHRSAVRQDSPGSGHMVKLAAAAGRRMSEPLMTHAARAAQRRSSRDRRGALQTPGSRR